MLSKKEIRKIIEKTLGFSLLDVIEWEDDVYTNTYIYLEKNNYEFDWKDIVRVMWDMEDEAITKGF